MPQYNIYFVMALYVATPDHPQELVKKMGYLADGLLAINGGDS
jgi:hypothetical protein